MTWTYDASLLSETTSVGRRYLIRLALGDTDTTDQVLQDEEIDAYLSMASDTLRLATIYALRALIAKYSRQADLWIGHTRVQASQRARQYRELLAIVEATGPNTLVANILFGGQSFAEKEDLDSDLDAVKLSFRVGQDDIVSPDPDE